MIGLLAVVGGVFAGWLVLAAMLGILIGRAIHLADVREGCVGTDELPERAR